MGSHDYRSFETARAAKKVIEEIMLVQPGENVVITADTACDMRVVRATADAAFAVGAHPVVVTQETRWRPGMEPPAPVAGAVKAADVWIEYSVAYILYTPAHRAAIEAGCRYLVLSGMDVDVLLRTIGNVDIDKTLAIGERLTEVVSGSDRIELRSEAGTDIVGTMKGRRVRHQGKRADTKGETITLLGQVTFMPIEESLNGTIVYDGTVWPPDEAGILRDPVQLTVENGVVKKIEGGREAQAMEAYIRSLDDPNMYCLAHYSLGINPGVKKVTGSIVEDERVFGAITIGLGSQGPNHGGKGISAVGHVDGIIVKPTIILDGNVIQQDGMYTDPELVRLCRDVGLPGY